MTQQWVTRKSVRGFRLLDLLENGNRRWSEIHCPNGEVLKFGGGDSENSKAMAWFASLVARDIESKPEQLTLF